MGYDQGKNDSIRLIPLDKFRELTLDVSDAKLRTSWHGSSGNPIDKESAWAI